ncbi:MAG: preprotein translocase subunit YajC [Reinekea sp.]|jgi:preprotein translocase subunit YajC|nr:preprotein translocase subunit YajC [Reinekea sp.]MDX1473260.1 preprotein translocase subunit YajC [Reinekea sp.]
MKKLIALALASAPVVALAAPVTAAQPSPWQLPIMLGIFFVIFWLMVWRPQSKRAKEHKNLLAELSKGDEVITSAGIAGKVTKVTDDYIQVEVAANTTLTFQKQAITATLPKGTIKAI